MYKTYKKIDKFRGLIGWSWLRILTEYTFERLFFWPFIYEKEQLIMEFLIILYISDKWVHGPSITADEAPPVQVEV